MLIFVPPIFAEERGGSELPASLDRAAEDRGDKILLGPSEGKLHHISGRMSAVLPNISQPCRLCAAKGSVYKLRQKPFSAPCRQVYKHVLLLCYVTISLYQQHERKVQA